MFNALMAANFPSIVCFIGAIILAYNGMEGWGWLILAGVLVSCSYETSKKSKSKQEPSKDE